MLVFQTRSPRCVVGIVSMVATLWLPGTSFAGNGPSFNKASLALPPINDPAPNPAVVPQLMSWTTIVMASIEKHSGPAPLALNLRIAEAESKNRRNRLIGWSLAGTGLAVGGLVVAGQQYKLFPISALCFLGASMFFVRSKGRAMVASDVASESERMDAIQ